MPITEKSPDSEHELRLRTWQERGRRADRLAEKRMKVLFFIVGLILVAMILYYTLRTKVSPAPKHAQNVVGFGPHFNPSRIVLGMVR